jgi:hypothetical protein
VSNTRGRRHDSKRPNRTTSAPPSSISRWSNFTGAKHGYKIAHHNHNSRRRAHKGGAPECRGTRSAPGQFLPSDDGSTAGAPEIALRVETTCRTCASAGSRAGTRQRSRRTSPTQPELDGEQNVDSADLEMIENVAESMIGPNQDVSNPAGSRARFHAPSIRWVGGDRIVSTITLRPLAHEGQRFSAVCPSTVLECQGPRRVFDGDPLARNAG